MIVSENRLCHTFIPRELRRVEYGIGNVVSKRFKVRR